MQQPTVWVKSLNPSSRTCDEKLSCNQENSRQISLKIPYTDVHKYSWFVYAFWFRFFLYIFIKQFVVIESSVIGALIGQKCK